MLRKIVALSLMIALGGLFYYTSQMEPNDEPKTFAEAVARIHKPLPKQTRAKERNTASSK